MSTATASAVQPVYTLAALHISGACGFPEFALSSEGAIALPDCTVSPAVQRGMLTGAAPTVLYQPNTDPTYGEKFACTAGDPAGGFYFVVTEPSGGNPRLYHAADSATGPTSLTLVPTEPTLSEVHVARGGGEFSNCQMAVASSVVVYLLTGKPLPRDRADSAAETREVDAAAISRDALRTARWTLATCASRIAS